MGGLCVGPHSLGEDECGFGYSGPKLKYLFTKLINPCGVGTKSQVIEANIIDHITRFSSYVV